MFGQPCRGLQYHHNYRHQYQNIEQHDKRKSILTYHLCLRFVCKLNLRRTRFTPELQTAFARLLPKKVQEHSTKVKEKECDDDDDDHGDDVDDDGDGEDDDYYWRTPTTLTISYLSLILLLPPNQTLD